MDTAGIVELVNREVKEYSLGQQPTELYQPMEYILDLKRDRRYSLLVFWGCYLFSGDTRYVLRPAMGIEIFKGFLVVHEDLLERRNNPNNHLAVHSKWNDNIAILSGDAMIFKAYELLIQVPNQLVKKVLRAFNHCFTELCEGRQLALNQPEAARSPQIIDLNPGALAGFSLQLGAVIAGAAETQLELLDRLGRELEVSLVGGSSNVLDSLSESLTNLDCDQNRISEFKTWVNSLS